MTTEASKQQLDHKLDHTTARIVAELADALLPRLRETVSAELSRTIESLPVNINREVEEALSFLRRFQVLFEDMAMVLNSAQSSASRLSDDLLPLSSACEMMKAATERLEQMSKPGGVQAAAQMNDGFLSSVEASLRDLEGILKADGRAHTKELNEFSAEVSEQVGWMKSNLPTVLEEALEKTLKEALQKEFLPHTSEHGAISESVRTLETRLARLEKIGKVILVEGMVLVAVLAAAVLYFW